MKSAADRLVVISTRPPGVLPYLREVMAHRALIWTLARRDLEVRYAQTVLGLLWTMLQPLTGLLIFTLVFDKFIHVDTGAMPYPLYAFSGMVCWYFFTFMVSRGGTSLVNHPTLIRQLHFPKLVLPLSQALVGFTDFCISFLVLGGLMAIWAYPLGWQLLMFPVFLLMILICGLAVSIWLSSLTLRFRDFHHIIPYVVNFGIWLTPVFYPATIVPPAYQNYVYLNPVAGILAGFRWSVLGGPPPEWWYFLPFVGVLLLFVTGLMYFSRIEGRIVDYV